MAKRWLGSATDITQENTYTIAGTWVAAETVTVDMGAGQMVVTIGSSILSSEIAEIISNAINAQTATQNLQGDESRTVGGQQVPEIAEVTASFSGSVVTVTAKTAGNPISGTQFPNGLAISTNSALGTITPSIVTAATGRAWWDNANNWSGGVAPVSSDELIYSDSNADILHGLTAAVRLTGLQHEFKRSYTGKLGLPTRNANGYEEWRPRLLAHDALTPVAGEATVRIGGGDGQGSSRLNFDFGTSTPQILVLFTNTPETGATTAVEIIGGGSGTIINANRGVAGVCTDGVSTGTVGIIMGYVTGQESDAQVFVGRAATLESVVKSGGILNVNLESGKTITSFEQKVGDSGTTVVDGEAACVNLLVNGGNVIWNSTGTIGTAGSMAVGGTGVLDFSHDNREKTIAIPVERNSESSRFLDPNGVVNSSGTLVLDYNNVRPSETGDQYGLNTRLTVDNPA